MSKSRETWNKKEKETIRKKKKDEKEKRKLDRKEREKATGKKSFEDMIAYVDENGMITSVAPDPNRKKKEIDASSIVISTPVYEDSGDEAEQLLTGRVQFFNNDKGYGFIKGISKNESYFVHVNDLTEPIKENDTVTFQVEAAQRGLKAVNVKIQRPE